MQGRRWFYTLLIATGLLCGVVVLAGGAVLTIRLAMLAPSQPQTKPDGAATDSSSNAAAAERDSHRPAAEPSSSGNSVASPGAVERHAEHHDTAERQDTNTAGSATGGASDRHQPEPAGDGSATADNAADRLASRTKLTSWEKQTGSYFGPEPADPLRRPEMVEIVVPSTKGSNAIWGATGRDDRGRIWYGVTEGSGEFPSAHLFELDPLTGASTDRGDVVTQLERAGVARKGECQAKIHSKIVQAEDGNLYFASMDEGGEKDDGSKMPTWGGHLWRLNLKDYRWEHLSAVPEALIAVGTTGRWVYALGYFDHVLYQYDTRSGQLRSVRVGASGGHVSRNFLVDEHGHAYVPRVRPAEAVISDTAKPPQSVATLVEYDEQLKEIRETPLAHYLDPAQPPMASHGIVGFVYLANHSLVMVTAVGYLYQITPNQEGPATVRPLDWFHPNGTAYIASLFSFGGGRYLVGVGRPPREDYQWVVYDLETRTSQARRLVIVDLFEPPRQDVLLYGSVTRDLLGRFYLAGRYVTAAGSAPLLMRVDPGQ